MNVEKNELTLDPNIKAKTIKLLKTFFVQNGKAKKKNNNNNKTTTIKNKCENNLSRISY